MKTLIFSFLLLSSIAMNSQVWKTDLSEAQIEAKANNKKVVLVFQGSDWCAPCIELERNIWSHEVFKNYAVDHYIMVKADFPRKKKNQLSEEQTEKNRALAEQYNKKGYFPLVVVFNDEGDIIGKTGFNKEMTPQNYIELINSYDSNEE